MSYLSTMDMVETDIVRLAIWREQLHVDSVMEESLITILELYQLERLYVPVALQIPSLDVLIVRQNIIILSWIWQDVARAVIEDSTEKSGIAPVIVGVEMR